MFKKAGFIKKMRLDSGLTPAELAKKLGVSQEIISEWEKEDEVPFMNEPA